MRHAEDFVSRKVKADGKLGTLITTLQRMLDDGSDAEQLLLKYRRGLAMAGSVAIFEQLLGTTHWGKLQQILHPQAAAA